MEAARKDARVGGPPVRPGDAFDVLDEAGFGVVTAAVVEAVTEVLAYNADGVVEADDPNE